jgi:hypothetical protein
VERHDRVEQAVHGQAAGLEVDAEVAGEEQVGLPLSTATAVGMRRFSRYQRSARTACSVTTRPPVMDFGSPSMRVTRSTSWSGPSGRRTRVGYVSTSANSGPRASATLPAANAQHCS